MSSSSDCYYFNQTPIYIELCNTNLKRWQERKKTLNRCLIMSIELLHLDAVEFNEKMKQNAIKCLSNLLLFLVFRFDYQFVVFFYEKICYLYLPEFFNIMQIHLNKCSPSFRKFLTVFHQIQEQEGKGNGKTLDLQIIIKCNPCRFKLNSKICSAKCFVVSNIS